MSALARSSPAVRLRSANSRRRRQRPPSGRCSRANDGQADGRRRDLGDQGRQRHALDAPAEDRHEQQVERDVQAVHVEGKREDRAGPLHADQPADADIDQQRRRRAPDPDVEIGAGQAFDPRRRLDGPEGEPLRRRLQRDDGKAEGRRQQGGAQRDVADFLVVAGAAGLCDEAGGRHAQEAEGPVQETEDQRADGDAADIGRRRQVPHHRGIDRAEQRLADIRQDDRHGEPEHAAMGYAAIQCGGRSGGGQGCACFSRNGLVTGLPSASRYAAEPVPGNAGGGPGYGGPAEGERRRFPGGQPSYRFRATTSSFQSRPTPGTSGMCRWLSRTS